MQIKNEFYCAILSLPKLYDHLHLEVTHDKYMIEMNLVRQKIFAYVRRNSTRGNVPDYVFRKIEEQIFTSDITIRKLYIRAVSKLSLMLYRRDGHIYVQDEYFEEWQNVITKVSPLQIISYFIYKNELNEYTQENKMFANSLLPSIYNKNLTYLAGKYSFNDLHIHLNGSTEADVVWLDFLNNIGDFVEFINKSSQSNAATEQFMDIAIDRTQHDLYDIREQTINYKMLIADKLKLDNTSVIEEEMSLFIGVWSFLDTKDFQEINLKTYLYILNYNYFYQLLIQQINQIGFDQFQKITFNEMRELTEKKYSQRYAQLQSPYNGYKSVIEGRFAPKGDVAKNVSLLDSINRPLSSKENYPVTVNLISHFIKQEDKKKFNDNACRHAELRRDLDNKVDHLLEVLNKPKYKILVHGFDGAANELHASPEVFVKAFNRLRENGYSNFTFHAGEDFIDLVSGIRYIYEAVEFLSLEHGNRIGHGTAIGINPKLWKQRLGSDITISRGEYLDNLLFVYKFILDGMIKHGNSLDKIKRKIMELANDIYDEISYYDVDVLVDAWLLRRNDPEEFFSNAQSCVSSTVRNIFQAYHYNKNVKQKHHELIEIKTDFLSDDLLINLQNQMILIINQKGIVIESLITSNVRISYYNYYHEHHLFRWLGFEEGFETAPLPAVVIGSDDPGIFVTNIRNEISHIYLVLKSYYKLSESVCWNVIEQLLKNNEIYLFDITNNIDKVNNL